MCVLGQRSLSCGRQARLFLEAAEVRKNSGERVSSSFVKGNLLILPPSDLLTVYTHRVTTRKDLIGLPLARMKISLPCAVSCLMLSQPVRGRTSFFHFKISIFSGFYFLGGFHSNRKEPWGREAADQLPTGTVEGEGTAETEKSVSLS